MKSFKQYVNEENMPYAGTSNGVIDVRDSAVRDNINKLLAGATNGKFLTPYIAFERVCKTLANFHIFPPRTTFFEGDSGAVNFAINQFGFKMGMTDDGRVVTAEEDPHHIYFEYRMSDCGMFEIFCEIVDQSELEEILDDLEDEMSGETENIEELDEETIDEVVTTRKMTSKEKKAHADYVVKHKEKLAANDTGIKAKKTFKDVNIQHGDYEKQPSKMKSMAAPPSGYYKVDESMEEKKEKKKAKFKVYRDERDESKKKREDMKWQKHRLTKEGIDLSKIKLNKDTGNISSSDPKADLSKVRMDKKSGNISAINELTAKLVGKVNKARAVGGKPSKTPVADATRGRAVVKKWLDSDVGKLKE